MSNIQTYKIEDATLFMCSFMLFITKHALTLTEVCLMLFSVRVLNLFPYNVHMTAASWETLRHTQRELHTAATDGSIGYYEKEKQIYDISNYINVWNKCLITLVLIT